MLLSDYLHKNILVIDLRYIGDCIFLIPLIRNLKKNLPNSKISALVNEGGESLLRLIPEINEVITVKRKEIKGRLGVLKFLHLLRDVRRRDFDTVIVVPQSDRPTIISFASGAGTRIGFTSNSWWRNWLLTHELKYDGGSPHHLIEYNLQILTELGLKIYDRQLSIKLSEEYSTAILRKYPVLAKEDKKSIIVHPGARGTFRQWGADNFARVINAFSTDYQIFLIGGGAEGSIIEEILDKLDRSPDIVTTELNLVEFASLCSLSGLFIGNDSAPIHIAAATGMFVIGIYGPTLSKFCKPWTGRSLLFDISTLECRPCEQDKCLSLQPKACIDVIKPEHVIEGVKNVLRKI